ncbi:hypothetical protein SNE26_20310 [Mucilaginibacter sp. cycad4]|uniref:SGNH/GDSL hydrolase family protein n=1 Tax=Mucilaginibacter sp. cycad4 TaxID=3342096 RepID=UPI002AAAF3C7|nr:SGNH/GDSL hydrolase family protein [Mucilaginibacter gossypii]WPU98372.1 hypothetical protein SNE26_20310 [Mucilaginibacter gossypii]
MASRLSLKSFFTKGAKPTAGQFASWIDSFWHKDEDTIPAGKIAGLSSALAGKASINDVDNEAATRSAIDSALQGQIDELAAKGNGIPTGGTTGQLLTKAGEGEGDVAWSNIKDVGALTEYWPNMPVNNIKFAQSYGSDITAYLSGGVYYESYSSLFFSKATNTLDFFNFAENNANSFQTLKRFYANSPLMANRNTGFLVEVGFNDFKGGDLEKSTNKVRGTLGSLLASAFMEEVYPANNFNAGSKTGVWIDENMSGRGSKAATLASFTNASAISSSVSGSSIVISQRPGRCTMVIGTYGCANSGELGGFTVSYRGNVIYTYDPVGKTNGITDNTFADNSLTPQVVLITDFYVNDVAALEITTTSNAKTIIDYIGWLGAASVYPPVFVLTCPEVSDAQYQADPANRSRANTAAMTAAIKETVLQFPGYPVTVVDFNELYDPNNPADSNDGIHPSREGHIKVSESVLKKSATGQIGYAVPVVPTGEKVVSVTNQGPEAHYDLVEIMVASGPLTSADFSSGIASVPGKPGQQSADGQYVYYCVGINQWRRTAQVAATVQDYYLATGVDDGAGALTSVQLNSAYPSATIFQHVRGINYVYEKIDASNWIKYPISIA